MRFSRDPSCYSTGSYIPFLWGSHMQKQYHRRTTLRTWEPWRIQERDAEWSAPTIAHHIHSASEPLGTTVAWRYDVPWDWLWDACHMARVCWGTRCKRFSARNACTIALSKSWGTHWNVIRCKEHLANCPEAVLGQATINIDWQVWKSLGDTLPKLYCIDLVEAYVTQESASLRMLCKKRYDLRLPNGHLYQKPSAKGKKGKENLCWVYCQVLASILLQETYVFCARNMGVHVRRTTSKCQRYKKMGWEIGFPCSQERCKEISK